MVIRLDSYKLNMSLDAKVEERLSFLQDKLDHYRSVKGFSLPVIVKTVAGSRLQMNVLRLLGDTIYLSTDDGAIAIYDISLIKEIEVLA